MLLFFFNHFAFSTSKSPSWVNYRFSLETHLRSVEKEFLYWNISSHTLRHRYERWLRWIKQSKVEIGENLTNWKYTSGPQDLMTSYNEKHLMWVVVTNRPVSSQIFSIALLHQYLLHQSDIRRVRRATISLQRLCFWLCTIDKQATVHTRM